MNLVVIAAASFELDPLVHSLQQRGLTPDHLMTGVGAVKAAQNSLSLAKKCRGKDVIFVGSCGSFTPFEQVQLVRASSVIWSPTGERMGLAYGVAGTNPPVELPPPPAWVQSLPERVVACGPSISLVSRPPEGYGADRVVENLELYSCAGAISRQAKSFCAILGITNQVGSEAHSQWKQHFTSAAGKTAEFISSQLPDKSTL